MKIITLNEDEDANEVTLERARELLKNDTLSDSELRALMDNLRAFCRIVIDIHQAQEKQKQLSKQSDSSEYKEAA